MNLINISGNTFYIRGGTNTGLYLFDDNSALIIDPGLSGARPNKIIKILNIVFKQLVITLPIKLLKYRIIKKINMRYFLVCNIRNYE